MKSKNWEQFPHSNLHISVRLGDQLYIVLPLGLTHAVKDLLLATATCQSIAFEKIPEELSTVEAAGKLEISRPTLMKMI